ncbi:hypothetical protein GRI40_00615 [Altererythrobacter aerius]|uniref:Uncharacterized protein n=1 Tax=Tsuneonella aeria TaxID=1837929 RepID=A0A6I4TBV2_9SPHN|nr:hypothetical protein [Tsuneonella aeria]MXO73725.1 hypothetical protein [Tsuneonella aeria]
MFLRLAALGALGYAGYKYLQGSGAFDAPPAQEDDDIEGLAGGPLSDRAKVVHADEAPFD